MHRASTQSGFVLSAVSVLGQGVVKAGGYLNELIITQYSMTRSEAMAGVSDIEGLHLLETLQALKLDLTDACDSSVAGHKRVTHG